MIKELIFDLDGTLLDTSRDICAVLNESLKRFNLPQISLQALKEYLGNGAKTLVNRAVSESNSKYAEEVYEDYFINFANCKNELTTLYDGEAAALDAFKSAGIKLAVISNKPQLATERVVNQHLNKFGFDFIIGQSESNPLKPDPTTTLKVIEKFGVRKDEVLFVGDGETDILTAANAGVKCVSVLWGYRSRKQLESAGARIFAESFKELENLVKSF
ncbi:MAG: HAD family hydrolase [Clostridia bacterium]|nr:HAD family hydrolase [Clostridia bacterium]